MDLEEKLELIMARLDTLDSIESRLDSMDLRFDVMETRFDSMETKFETMDVGFETMEANLSAMDAKTGAIEEKLSAIGAMEAVENRLKAIDARFKELGDAVRDIRLTLENETNKNMMHVAKGYLDLLRKIDEALKVENEKEMLVMRVNILENELRRVKEKLAKMA